MMTLKRILLVEDNPYDMELTLSALEDYNLANKVDSVGDGVEALDYLNCRGQFSNRQMDTPVVILLDLKLPRMNGLELIKAIKADTRFMLIPIVILTSSREDRDIQEAYDLGANAYVVKPVDFNDFAMTVKEVGKFWAILNEFPQKS